MRWTVILTADEVRLLDDIVSHEQAATITSSSETSTLQSLRGKVRVALNRASDPLWGLADAPTRDRIVPGIGRCDMYFSPRLECVLAELGNTVDVRARRALLGGGIYTVEQLVACDRYALLKLRNFGPLCIESVKACLARFGLELRT